MRQKGLQELCLQVLARYIDVCPSLEFIPSELCDRLFEIVLEQYPPTPQTLRLLASLSPANITTLNLTQLKPLEERPLLALLGETPEIRVLLLQDDPKGTLTPKLLARLAAAGRTTLHTLSLTKCVGLDNGALKNVAAFTRLESLRLDGWKKLTSQGLGHLVALPNLKELSLAKCSQISTLEPLAKLIPRLHFLNISFTGIRGKAAGDAMQSLAKSSTKLKTLLVQGLTLTSTAITADTFAPSGWARLTSLALGRNPAFGTKTDLGALARLKFLVALDLTNTVVDNGGVEALGKHLGPELKVLGLSETRVGPEVAALLTLFPSLSLLDLSFNLFDLRCQDFLATFLGRPKLRLLDLSFCEWGEEAAAPPPFQSQTLSVIFREGPANAATQKATLEYDQLWASHFDFAL